MIGEEDDDLIILEEPPPEVINLDDDEPSKEIEVARQELLKITVQVPCALFVSGF